MTEPNNVITTPGNKQEVWKKKEGSPPELRAQNKEVVSIRRQKEKGRNPLNRRQREWRSGKAKEVKNKEKFSKLRKKEVFGIKALNIYQVECWWGSGGMPT